MMQARKSNQLAKIKYADAKLAIRSGDFRKAADCYARHYAKRANRADEQLVASYANTLMRLERYREAMDVYKHAVLIDPCSAFYNYRVGYLLERKGENEEARRYYTTAIIRDETNAEYLYRRARVNVKMGSKLDALSDVESAIALNEDDRRYYKLVREVSNVLPVWRQLEILEQGLESNNQDVGWLRALGAAAFKMRRWHRAVDAYEKAIQFSGSNWKDGIYGAIAAANITDDRYLRFVDYAIEGSGNIDASKYGVAPLFARLGFRDQAIIEYTKLLKNGIEHNLLYSRGMIYFRQHRWQDATNDFRIAVGLMPDHAEYNYRLGFVLERQGYFEQAAVAYRASITSASISDYRRYRSVYCYERAGKFVDGLDLIIQSGDIADGKVVEDSIYPGLDSIDPSGYVSEQIDFAAEQLVNSRSSVALAKMAKNLSKIGNYGRSIEFYRHAIVNAIEHPVAFFTQAAQVAAHAGMLENAACFYLESRIFQRPLGIDYKAVIRTNESLKSAKFVEFTETRKLNPHCVLIESNHGKTYSGNVLPILRAMISDEKFAEMEFIVVSDSVRAPVDLVGCSRIRFVPRDSDAYIHNLATSKWLINDNTFPPYFIRRSGQYYLNTWHGTPMKTLGKKIRGGQMDHRNAARNLLHVTHLAAPNEFTARGLLEDNDIAHMFEGVAAITGSPRNDVPLAISEAPALRDELLKKLGLKGNKKVVLYAPTWRGDLKTRKTDVEGISAALKVMSSHTDVEVIFRGHPMDEASLKGLSFDNVSMASSDITTNELLSVADLLITDYSSVVFDAASLGTPVLLYTYDYEEYKSSRGFAIDPGELTSNVASTSDRLNSVLEEFAMSGQLSGRWSDDLLSSITSYEDGCATERVIEFFFGNSSAGISLFDTSVYRHRKELLFYQGSFIPNGITASFQALTKQLCRDSVGVTVVVEPDAVFSDEQRVQRFSELDSQAHSIARVGVQSVTPEELWVINRFNSIQYFESKEMADIYWGAFTREATRLFGTMTFDSAVCFEGYARFWMAVVAGASAQMHSAYLHNDMVGEARTRFPYLRAVLEQYPRFDSLISVSDSVHESNSCLLPNLVDVRAKRFMAVPNLIDVGRIKELSEQPIADGLQRWISPNRFTFINCARLSPEKGQIKLIESLRKLIDQGYDAELVIVGQGPLKDALRIHCNRLGLSDRVYFTGYLANPFPAVVSADAFVLSSDYEGQGLVILEALVLGKPVLSTDVVGPRSLLKDGSGLLVGNDVESLAAGMRKIMCGWQAAEEFSFDSYIRLATSAFRDATFPESS